MDAACLQVAADLPGLMLMIEQARCRIAVAASRAEVMLSSMPSGERSRSRANSASDCPVTLRTTTAART
ncbi:hypothetical protein [Streptosporangium canum]|uniref:hypothetical protein n=1 Tax=Streptosporangium canum TaxID=324952 RepID=UPI003F4B23F4